MFEAPTDVKLQKVLLEYYNVGKYVIMKLVFVTEGVM